MQPKRFYGTVPLDAARVDRDASRSADEAPCHLPGLVGSDVEFVLEIQVLPFRMLHRRCTVPWRV